MTNRPSIPVEVSRAILIESGHRCAVCGTPCPLERAHIIPWNKSKDHSVENLICLCSNCHTMADTTPWDTKTLHEYKLRPWVNRQYQSNEIQLVKTVVVQLKMEISEFGQEEQRYLMSGLSALTDKLAGSLKILSIEAGSVYVTIQMPSDAADTLLSKMSAHDKELNLFLFPLEVISLKETNHLSDIISKAQTHLKKHLLLEALIVSNEPIVSHGVESYLKRYLRVSICHQATSVNEAIKVVGSHPVRLVVVTANEDTGYAPMVVRAICQHSRGIPVIVIARVQSPDVVRRVMDQGARGVITFTDDLEELENAARALLGHTPYVSLEASKMLNLELPHSASVKKSTTLSDREMQIFTLVGKGMSVREIGMQLSISHKTVETHKQRIKAKLQLQSTSELTLRATAAQQSSGAWLSRIN